MLKLIKQWLIIGLALSFGTMTSIAQAGDDFEMTDLELSGDWVSAQECSEDGCFWRASTACEEDQSVIFSVITMKDQEPLFLVLFVDAPLSMVNEWEVDKVPLKVKLRVDKNQTFPFQTEFVLNKEERSMGFTLYLEDQTDNILRDLKRGNTLRLRLYGVDYNMTIPFSLVGASKAINRVITAYDRKPARTIPDPYFDDNE